METSLRLLSQSAAGPPAKLDAVPSPRDADHSAPASASSGATAFFALGGGRGGAGAALLDALVVGSERRPDAADAMRSALPSPSPTSTVPEVLAWEMPPIVIVQPQADPSRRGRSRDDDDADEQHWGSDSEDGEVDGDAENDLISSAHRRPRARRRLDDDDRAAAPTRDQQQHRPRRDDDDVGSSARDQAAAARRAQRPASAWRYGPRRQQEQRRFGAGGRLPEIVEVGQWS
jgi:hypothetical protein